MVAPEGLVTTEVCEIPEDWPATLEAELAGPVIVVVNVTGPEALEDGPDEMRVEEPGTEEEADDG